MSILSGFIHNLTDKSEERKAENEMQRRLIIAAVTSWLFLLLLMFVTDEFVSKGNNPIVKFSDFFLPSFFIVILFAPRIMKMTIGQIVSKSVFMTAVLAGLDILSRITR